MIASVSRPNAANLVFQLTTSAQYTGSVTDFCSTTIFTSQLNHVSKGYRYSLDRSLALHKRLMQKDKEQQDHQLHLKCHKAYVPWTGWAEYSAVTRPALCPAYREIHVMRCAEAGVLLHGK